MFQYCLRSGSPVADKIYTEVKMTQRCTEVIQRTCFFISKTCCFFPIVADKIYTVVKMTEVMQRTRFLWRPRALCLYLLTAGSLLHPRHDANKDFNAFLTQL